MMKGYSGLSKKLKIQLWLSLILTIVLVVGTFAWFSNQRFIQTMTVVEAPHNLKLLAGNMEEVTLFKLDDIDISNGTSKAFVFSVCGDSLVPYHLQLAHTSNIPFNYSIIRAEQQAGKTSIMDQKGKYYTLWRDTVAFDDQRNSFVSGVLQCDYTNEISGKIASAVYHGETYGDYANVQKNAEPIYWVSQPVNPVPYQTTINDGTNMAVEFADYYVLQIQWSPALQSELNKETDMIYITVENY